MRTCPYCHSRPKLAAVRAKTCGHPDCKIEQRRERQRVGGVTPPAGRPCPYCTEGVLPQRANAATCGNDACKKKRNADRVRDTMRKRTREKRASDPSYGKYFVQITCEMCGESARASKYDPGRFCSRTCRDLHNIESGHNARALSLGRKSSVPRTPKTPAAKIATPCTVCGAPMEHYAKSPRKYCSPQCRHTAKPPVDRPWRSKSIVVFQRDNYTCQLCGEPTSAEWSKGDYFAPTIDHIKPRARGGTDDEGNLQTAHWICNSFKSDREDTESIDIYEVLSRTQWAKA